MTRCRCRWLLGLAGSGLLGCTPALGAAGEALFVVGGMPATPRPGVGPGQAPEPVPSPGDAGVSAPVSPMSAVASGGGAGGGGAGGGGDAGVVGWVREAGPTGRPVPGAWVLTTDGRRAAADAGGRFRLPGPWPADGLWAVGATGHLTSVVTGLDAGGEPTLHLRALLRPADGPAGATVRRVTLVGQVLGPGGGGREGLVVRLGGPGVLGGIPVATDARGEFSLSPLVDTAATAPASVVVVDPAGEALAVATGVVLTGVDQQLDLVPGTPGLDALQTVAATHGLRVAATAPAGLPSARVSVDVVAPDGTSLPLYEVDGAYRLAALPGVRYALSATAVAPDATAYSGSEVPDLPISWSQPETRRTEALMAPPTLPAPPEMAPGARWRWAGVPGAQGYTAELTSDDTAEGLPWEGFSAAPELAFAWPGAALPAGSYTLAVTAWDVPGLSARVLAQATGVRRLRPVPRTGAMRYATRRLTLRL